MLEVINLKKSLGDFKIENISFTLKPGYIMGVIGPNGAGKTTLIKLLLGLIKADEGEISIFNNPIENEIFIKNNIGFVFDDLNFYKHLSVKDFGRIISSFYSEFDKNKFDNYLNRFNLNKKASIGLLSKGEGMRLMLSAALSHNAKLLILDEPTAGLDPIVRKEMLKLLQEAIEDGERSVIFSTHITSDLDEIADYIVFMDKGKIVFSEDIENIKEKYKILRATKEELKKTNYKFIGLKKTPYYYEGLMVNENGIRDERLELAILEDIMFYYIKGEKND